MATIANESVIEEIYLNKAERSKRAYRRGVILVGILFLICVAALRPQWGFSWRESKKKGLDIVVAVDVSESMLAQDIPPNRLERTKREVYDLLDILRGDRIGLVAFAGYAFTEVPLTEDYTTFRLFLQMLNKDLIPVAGTNVGSAIEKALQTFTGSEKMLSAKRDRAILLITDGEDLEGNWQEAGSKAKEMGVQIYVMGVGTPTGAPIPIEKGYKKDKNGSVVVTKLNEALLKDLANKTGGIYVSSIASAEDTSLIYKRGIRSNLEGKEYDSGRLKKWNEYFQLPLSVAVILLIWPAIQLFAFNIKNISSRIWIKLVFILFLFTLTNIDQTFATDLERIGKEGKDAYERGEFEHAKTVYEQALSEGGDDYRFNTGLGASYYRLGDFENALKYFAAATEKSKENNSRALSLYNLGNTKVQLNLLKEAIKDYEESLKLQPNDQNALDNLAYAKRLLEEQQKQQQNQSSSQNSSQDQQKQQQNNSSSQDSSSSESSSESSSSGQSSSEQNQSQNSESSEQSSSSEDPSNQQQSSSSDKNEQSSSSGNSAESSSSSENSQSENSSEDQTSQPQPHTSSNSSTMTQQQDKAILDSVAENRALFNNYRRDKALKELGSLQQKLPEKDW
ncbi:MAG: VWA domain-containing protein [Deltaproteobacteria bacterium]|nr:VWA domain-containing protein [Deltaproteobacteria bacterium]